ncbi:MAG: lipid A deacylase LpxR family protein [bacterium]|nr:lipid A deacylase LpxR family protein [bacterium]
MLKNWSVWVLLTLCIPSLGWAEDLPDEPPHWRFYSVQVENDFLAFSGDRFYTHGTEFSLLEVGHPTPAYLSTIAAWVPFFEETPQSVALYQMGQKIFTPEATWSDVLESDDRPYAGWIYGSVSLVSLLEDEKVLRSANGLTLTLGVVGPAAHGEKVQKAFHQWVDDEPAQGWQYQLKNEPTLGLGYVRRWQILEKLGNTGLDYEVAPHFSMALGNVYTYGGGGMILRIGGNLRSDFGPPSTISPGFPGTVYFAPGGPFSWYVFMGYESRIMGRNLFLDGNTFDSSHRVHREMIVGDVQRGFLFQWPRLRISMSQMIRSKEFDGQSDPVTFGSLNITWVR